MNRRRALHAAVFTQGHLAFHFSFLSRFSQHPTKEAWEALTLVLVLMYQTRRRHVLTYRGGKMPD